LQPEENTDRSNILANTTDLNYIYGFKMLYTNATIITVNTRREIILDGAMLVQGTRITDIGKTAALKTKYPDEDVYDLTGHIVIPGLISTHMHTAQTLLR
jgi:cytosine/adenosine deaminase-related metal-dependent hydrolase